MDKKALPPWRVLERDRKLMRQMVAAAQGSYEPSPEYGLTDADMERALRAALDVAAAYNPRTSR
jgi:hypothetical protein